MWMSTRTTSASPAATIAGLHAVRRFARNGVRQLCAAVPQKLAQTLRAGSSSSTMTTRSALIGWSIGHRDTDLVAAVGDARIQASLDVEMELQAFADVGERHVIPLAMLIVLVVWIRQLQPEAIVPPFRCAPRSRRRDSRLDSVVDRVFHQGLQEHRRHQSLLDGRIEPPIDPEPSPKRSCSKFRY